MSIYNLSFCTPTDVPYEVLEYDTPLEQLSVGKSGKLGILQLELEKDKYNNKTSIKNQVINILESICS